jgi:hypothetical protein
VFGGVHGNRDPVLRYNITDDEWSICDWHLPLAIPIEAGVQLYIQTAVVIAIFVMLFGRKH